MAAIVSQLAAANRRRKANKKNTIPIDKSVYVLPPFDPCFKPEVHNRYIKHKQAHLAHQEFISRIGTVSPVHIHQLQHLGSLRMKSKRPAKPSPIDQQLRLEQEDLVSFDIQQPMHHHQPAAPAPKRGIVASVPSPDEPQVELRLLEEETMQPSISDNNTAQ